MSNLGQKLKSGGAKRLMKLLGFSDELKLFADSVRDYQFSDSAKKFDRIVRFVIDFFPMINDFLDDKQIDDLLISLEYSIDANPEQRKKVETFLEILPVLLVLDEKDITVQR